MSTTTSVRYYLDKQDVRYATISFPGAQNDIYQHGSKSINPSQVAKATILKDLRGMLMAVLPGPNRLDLDLLNRQLHRNLQLAEESDYKSIFTGCAPGIYPALGEAYGFETIIDDTLLNLDLVYVVSGNPNELIRVSGHDFQLLHANAWYGNTFSHISEDLEVSDTADENRKTEIPTSVSKIKQQIEKTTKLPPMPSMAQKIIQLNTNPYAHANDLALLVEQDPSLAAQVIRYAQSPFYGFQGQITSVKQAISRVLGYDLVMNIALGISATRPFKNSLHGPLGLHAYWRHATYSAALAQALCNIVPRRQRPRSGTAYLAGLLHNFGFLILGYLYPKEFAQLNAIVIGDSKTPVIEHENQLISTNHTEIGAWLMEVWNMPSEITTAVKEHHNTNYAGAYSEYVYLTMLADNLLKGIDIGDASTSELPLSVLEGLGITEEQALSVMEKTIQSKEDLDSMARQLAA